MPELHDALKNALDSVLAHESGPVALHEPDLTGNELAYVTECIQTGWVSSVGSYVTKFEQEIAKKSGTAYGVAVVNGTAALHIALQLMGVGKDDEVLVPTLTFIATANAVTYCGAIPHFIDSESTSLGICPDKLKTYLRAILGPGNINKNTGRRIAAIVPVHIFGHPVDMDAILEIADVYGIPVIEDAAESLGSLYKDRKAGSLGRIAALSFNGNKIVTTGGGGAIVTNDQTIAARAKHITTTAKAPHNWFFDHDEIGYNYRMPNINAALGVAQLEKLDSFVEHKRNLSARYAKALDGIAGLSYFKEAAWAKSNYWLNAIMLDEGDYAVRDSLLDSLNGAGYQCRPLWTLMHRQKMFETCPAMNLDNAIDIEKRLINIPSSAKLGKNNAA